MNKKLILSLLGISLSPIINSNLILETEASNISKTQEDLSPLITYTTEKIGDREKMRVTVTVEDRSGTGIKEFRDHNNNLINSNTITVEFNRRVNATFIAIDNNNNKSEINIDLNWINPYTSDRAEVYIDRKNDGSTYWGSSSLREWLNSSSTKVDYTNNPPSKENTLGNGYDKEAGFLSEFTKEEINAIANTKHRVLTMDLDSKAIIGGTGNPGHFNTSMPVTLSANYNQVINYKNYTYSLETDKVYLLNPYEVYWFLERRNFETRRFPTEVAQNKCNTNSNYKSWSLYGGSYGGTTELNYIVTNSGVISYDYNSATPLGVVPVLNLKPNYTLDNGTHSSELNIGDYVEFGTYLGSKIQWQVINISNEGYPMLLATHILDIKEFNSKGQEPRLYSDYISFNKVELDLSNDIEYNSTFKSTDKEPPQGEVLNEEVLEGRHNNEFTLKLRFSDNDSGIKYVIMPNGSKTYSAEFDYTVFENKEYIFGIMDNAGNYNKFGVPVANINQDANLTINTSSEDWSNNDALIYIASDNTIKQTLSRTISGNSFGTVLPNYISYSNATFKVTGTAILNHADPSVLNRGGMLEIGFHYHVRGNNNGYSYTANPVWNYGMKRIPLDDIILNKSVSFEFDITVPSNYYKDLTPAFQLSLPNDLIGKASVQLKDLTYYLPDDSDFAINSIELPNGQIVENVKEYTDVISEDGIHNLTYKVLDNRGKITEKTITVKVDKTAPTLDLNYNTNITNQNIAVSISASDATSGVKRIKLPNGNYITNLNSTYTISGDGEYTFECEDVAGNITTKTIIINNIDKDKPSITIDKNKTEWTNKPIKININTRD